MAIIKICEKCGIDFAYEGACWFAYDGACWYEWDTQEFEELCLGEVDNEDCFAYRDNDEVNE